MSKYRGRFGHFQGQPEMFSNNLLARSRRALAYRGQNVGNRCLWRVLENLRNRAVSRPFFCIFDRFIPKNRQLRAPTHSVRSIQLGIERDISSTGFRHPNENWGHYAPVPNLDKRRTPSRFATKGAFAALFSQGFQLPCPPWARKQAKTGWGTLG